MDSENLVPQYYAILQQYLEYSKRERNLAATTLKTHREYVTAFLKELGDSPAKRLQEISPTFVLAFFTRQAQDKSWYMRRHLQGTLRSFLRFCLQKGHFERDLAAAVPCLRSYKLSGVPRGICESDALKTLRCIDRTTSTGRRDFAIIQMLHTYGVRSGQVRALRLADIHWRENRIRFPAHKGGKELIEPLTDDVGESLLDYLRHGRPHVPYPEVFLAAQPPFQPLKTPSAISGMVHKRLNRAGVSNPHQGSHIFRHAFAMRMLRHGQSLKAIADLLGHRNINTTFIYTKADLQALRQVTLEWPEE
jgi:site-specific recombinase XerD